MIKRGCSGRRSYATFQQAATGAQRARNKERLVHPYHCKHCNLFHTGGSTGQPQKHARKLPKRVRMEEFE